jgi:UDP:flavonoid glycosyltransferase YjiC (YdhE family)
VERAGAGLALPKRSSREQIRTALERLLGDAGYRDAACVLSDRIHALDGLNRAAGAVETLLSVESAQR